MRNADGNASERPARKGVIAVERALALLEAFTDSDRSLTLSELARRTALDKATILRLSASLRKSGFLIRNEDASWRLGPKLARLGMMYQTTFQVRDVIEPALARLSQLTGESAAVHVREGDYRVCLYRVDSIQTVRHHTRVGDMLPLPHGAPGRVLLAFSGEPGEPYETIRQRYYHATLGERDPQVASIACPIFEAGQRLLGTVGVAGPVGRFGDKAVARHLSHLKIIANELTAQLGGTPVFHLRREKPAKSVGATRATQKEKTGTPPGGSTHETSRSRMPSTRRALRPVPT